jgi:hypothetical protein
MAVCVASAAVSEMGVPLGAETATSSPIALSGRGKAAEKPERSAAAPIKRVEENNIVE